MSGLLPSTPDTSAVEEADPRVIGVDSDEADDLLAALSSGTARRLLTALHDEPATPSELAERADTSLQNTQYHLGKLEAAEVVEVIDTVYSEKGREMKVYGPSDRPLVVFAGREADSLSLRAALSRLLGAFGFLALVSLLIQMVWGDGLPFGMGASSGGDAAAADFQAETVTTTADAAASIDPGLLFFAGGAVVLLVVFGVWYLRQR
ncbi:ArsR/SmtB family transcription factor [Halobacteriaceae archaeon GCM10025711]